MMEPVFEEELQKLDALLDKHQCIMTEYGIRRLIYTIRLLREGIAAREEMEKQRIKDIKRRRGEIK